MNRLDEGLAGGGSYTMEFNIPEEVLSRELDGEAVLLDLRSGKYFGLNATGARTWALMKEGVERDKIPARIVQEFEVDLDTARADVDRFIAGLLERGLITKP